MQIFPVLLCLDEFPPGAPVSPLNSKYIQQVNPLSGDSEHEANSRSATSLLLQAAQNSFEGWVKNRGLTPYRDKYTSLTMRIIMKVRLPKQGDFTKL